MAMDERGLGRTLQAARQAAGLTQQQLCHQANLSFSTLTKIERGAIKAPSIFTIQAIAAALNVGLDELVGQTGNTTIMRTLSKTKSGAGFIYFDVNGCLVHQRAFTKLSHDTGVPENVIESAYWLYNDEICRGTMSMSDFNDKLAAQMGLDSFDWQDYYLETIDPIEPMQELLKWAAQHYKVGLLTNIMPGQVSALSRAGKLPAIKYDAVIDSSEVGAIKPEAQIYEIAQARANLPAGEIMFIDNDRVNVMAASKLGWQVMRFDDSRPEEMTEAVRKALQPAD